MDIISEQTSILLFCFILSCFLIFITPRSRPNLRQVSTAPRGPPRLPFIGNIHLVGKHPHRSFADLSKKYGPVMSLKLGFLNSVVISSRDAAREVLRTHDQILSGRYVNAAVQSNNHHDFSVAWVHPTSTRWRMLRKLSVTQMFSPQRIEATKAMRMKRAQELVNFISESSEREEAVDISRALFVTALNIISNILFSVNIGSYNSKDSSVFQELITGVMDAIGNPDLANFFPFMRFLDLQGNSKKMKDCSDKLFQVFREIYNARIVEKSSRTNEKDASSNDFMDALIDLHQGDEPEININEIEHLLFDLFIAGTDTTSSTVEWAMAELLRSPKSMTKVQDEINGVMGQNGVIQESDISELSYLQAVVKETFRLHPAAPLLLPRKAETDVDILGFIVPKNTQVLVNVWAIGRDPNVWENPNRFEPKRFLGKEMDVKGKDYELTPFGAGRRICPGMPLAVKTVPLMLASLLYSFDWKLPNGVGSEDLDMDETFGLTLHKTSPLLAVPLKKRAIG
ncbi:PREDICTED: cytochrome P450 76C2-like [Camelina sativa]|uniref:Cytochrome P450 76C2-like n=1 Tax=Camelina sativa TaxID=90675 RepID=A0ABM0YZ26_CAMSA|nr:PREDICTED: cytochrome P450 76C2-like [Camelina sativa]